MVIYEWVCLNNIDNGDGTSSRCSTRFSNDVRNPERSYCPHCGVRGGFVPYSSSNSYLVKRSI